jgi:hypothetical protein
MHSYRKRSLKPIWVVGFADADSWHALKDFTTEEAAAAYVSYLNGGNNPEVVPWFTQTAKEQSQ